MKGTVGARGYLGERPSNHIALSVAHIVAALSVALSAALAHGGEPSKEGAKIDGDSGVTVRATLASARVFRGYNVFQDDSQHDRHGVFSPSVEWSILETGLRLAYEGHYQTNGENIGYNVNVGRGHEQVLAAGWSSALSRGFDVDVALTYYFFPFAFEDLVGVANPSYLEPAARLAWERADGPRLALLAAYHLAVQDRLANERYLFFCPSIGKIFASKRPVALSLALELGYKLFDEPKAMRDGMLHVQVDTAFPVAVGRWFLVTPAAHITWVYLGDSRVGEQTVVWFSLAILAMI